jgi:arginine exporter protein ArgO
MSVPIQEFVLTHSQLAAVTIQTFFVIHKGANVEHDLHALKQICHP